MSDTAIKTLAAVVVIFVLLLLFRPKRDINSEQARKLVADGAQLIDVRSVSEFDAGHIEGAKNIPVDVIGSQFELNDKDTPIIVYCRSGARSTRAARTLRSNGFTEVYNLGGMSNW